MECYKESLEYEWSIKIPNNINFNLELELTTNIEDIVFMGISGVDVNIDGVDASDSDKANSGNPVYIPNQDTADKINDRVTIDLGNVRV